MLRRFQVRWVGTQSLSKLIQPFPVKTNRNTNVGTWLSLQGNLSSQIMKGKWEESRHTPDSITYSYSSCSSCISSACCSFKAFTSPSVYMASGGWESGRRFTVRGMEFFCSYAVRLTVSNARGLVEKTKTKHSAFKKIDGGYPPERWKPGNQLSSTLKNIWYCS